MPALSRFEGQTRALLKVQEGCDGHCAYCIVPQTRPTLSSKSLQEVAAEAQALVRAGHQEIVVTGVYLGAYGQWTVLHGKWPQGRNPHLGELLDALARVLRLTRIRLGSLDPSDLTPEWVEVLQRHPAIMPPLHLSLQFGSDEILKRMGRQYTPDAFRRVVTLLRTSLDRPALTTGAINHE